VNLANFVLVVFGFDIWWPQKHKEVVVVVVGILPSLQIMEVFLFDRVATEKKKRRRKRRHVNLTNLCS